MRKIGALVAIAALAAAVVSPSPSAAFGLRVGPFHIGLPFFGLRQRHRLVPVPATQTAGLHDEASLGAVEPAQGLTSALLYPALALPAIYDDVFWPPSSPPSSPPWPFSYDAIFQTAFAKARQGQDVHACQQPDRGDAIVARIKNDIRPTGQQVQQLQKLGGALGMAAGYLAKTCPNEIPASPVARLQLMEWQIEKLAMALDIVRAPLQDFEQSLNDSQRARFAATLARSAASGRADRADIIAPACAVAPTAIDWSIEQISASVQPTDTQRDAMASIKQAFESAAGELDGHCPAALPLSPLARLEATQADLDATWRALVSIQVALADFESGLSDEQRARFDATDFAAVQ